MKRLVLALLCGSTSLYGSAILETDPSTMNTSKDYVNWAAQLGPDHTSVMQSFIIGSSMNDYIKGQLTYGAGTVAVAGSSWKNGTATKDSANTANSGVAATDDLLWTNNGMMGTGPLSLSFQSGGVYGAGAFIQADGFSQFTARIQAFSGFNSVFDMMVTSDTKGDAVFLGVADDTPEITKIVYSIVSAPRGYTTYDFAVDTLYILKTPLAVAAPPPPPPADPVVPEPGMFPIVALVLAGLAWKMKKTVGTNLKSLS